MKAARVTEWGSPPRYVELPELLPPTASQLQLKVVSAGIARAVRGRVARQHPNFYDEPLPFDPSVDGVGVDENTGDLYFISSLAAPLFALHANVDKDQLTELEPGSDPVAVAVLANPTASSWMALQCRATGGCRVVGLARNEQSLVAVQDLDVHIVLQSPLQITPDLGPVDIIRDWVGGPAAIELLQNVQSPEGPGQNLQYIQCGGLASEETLVVPVRLLNVKPIKIMASGVGSLSREDITREMKGLVGAMSSMKPPFEVLKARLEDVKSVWESDEGLNKRLAITP